MSEIRAWPGVSVARLGAWGLRSGLAVADQAVFSAAGLVVNVLLARWMAPEAYGAFAVAFAVFLFMSGFHNALIIEPMSVLGPAGYAGRLAGYFRSQLRLHLAVTVALAVPLVAAGALLGVLRPSSALPGALAGAGLALPMVLLLWLARRFFYVLQSPGGALAGSTLHVAFALGGVLAIERAGWLTPFAAFLVVGLASAASAAWLLLRAHGAAGAPAAEGAAAWRGVLRENWNYGRWVLVAGLLYTASVQVQMLVAAAYVGLEGAAVLRAMQIPMLVMTQAITAIALLALPALAVDFGQGRLEALRRKGRMVTVLLTAAAALYALLLWWFAAPIEQLLYGGKFAAYAWLIPVLGLVGVFTAVATGYSLVLRAIQRPKHYVLATGLTSVVAVGTALGFTWLWGIEGAAASVVLTYAAGSAIAFVLYRTMACRGVSDVHHRTA